MADDFKFEITQALGTLSQGPKGWDMELNMVSWGGRPPKYDIRTWSADHQKMTKGVTLTKEEVVALKAVLEKIDLQ